GAHGGLVKRSVEAPPDALQYLGEVGRRRQVVGHAPGERGIKVVVGAHIARDDEGARAVPPCSSRRCRADGGNPPCRDNEVSVYDLGRVERDDDGPARERDRRVIVVTARSQRTASLLSAIGTS